MARSLQKLFGTRKRFFIIDGDEARHVWTLRGPYCDASLVNHVIGDPRTGRLHAAGRNGWIGDGI